MLDRPKRIAVIGSTGSIGRQALEIIAAEPQFRACVLAAGANWELLAEQARRFRPEVVAIAEPPGNGCHAPASAVCEPGRADTARVANDSPRTVAPTLLTGPDAAERAIRLTKPDLVLTALMGAAGLAPTLAAIECKADLAIANKETLVMGGAIVMPAARAAGINVLPVDSEHSGVFQCLAGNRRADVRRVILTASGGPFRQWELNSIRSATREQALNHPTWQMGQKITIDSATLMNKALEVIEAHWLFDLPAERIEVLIHPESIVHAAVEYSDGSVIAQMGLPSMATPISLALYYPRRAPAPAAGGLLELGNSGPLHFSPPEPERYPALALGYDVIRRGGTAGATLNAANEAAVAAFLQGRIAFGRIVPIVQEVLNRAASTAEITVSTLAAADAAARTHAAELIGRA